MNGNIWATILPLVILIAVMSFLLIRPQKKREKEVNAMRSSVQVGDEIITIGGICGKVVKTKEDSLVIQVGADKVKFEIMRWAVSKVVESAAKAREEETAEKETKKASKPKKLKKTAPAEEETEKPEETQEAAPEEAEKSEEPAEAEAETETVEETAEKEE